MTTIQKQRDLMRQALHKLDEIDTINSFIKPLDPKMADVMVEDMREHYAGVMIEIATTVVSVKHDEDQPTLLKLYDVL